MTVARAVPPGPRGFETLGFFGGGSFAGTLAFLAAQARRHGPVTAFGVGPRRLYLIDDPFLLREIFVERQHAFGRSPGAAILREVLGTNVLTSEEPLHRARRRMLQPAFHRARIAAYGAIAAERSRALVAGWRDGDVVDIGAAMTRLTLEVTGRALLGADAGDRAERMSAALARAMGAISWLGPILEALPAWAGPVRRTLPRLAAGTFARARAELDAVLGEAIANRRGAPGGETDLLGLVLRARDEDGCRFDDRAVVDELATLLFAGHETTANVLTWAWYRLGREPAVADALVTEAAALGRDPGYDDLDALPVAHAAFSETLRLHPAASAFGRCVLEPIELGGYPIAAGSGLVISPYVSHRNPRWFTDPERFSLERWTAPTWPEFAFLPFGGGARRCIGEAFARMEGALALAIVARRFRLRTIDPEPVSIGTATLRPARPIRMRLEACGA